LKLVKILRSRINTDHPHISDDRWAYYYKRATDFFINFRSPKFYDAQTYNVKGVEYSQNNRYKSAIDNFSRAIFLQPDFVDAYNNRGLTYSKNGYYQLAIDDFNQVIRLKPDFVSAYINRGVTYLTSNKKDLGCLDAQKACSLGNCELLKMAKKEGYCR
jgi:tetratricopeptide (TPR) repeat protein